jgi:hypothetical protein
VKRRPRRLQLSEEQQLIVGLVLVILVAVSLLYCLGFASLAVREAWQNAPLPWSETEFPPENLEVGTTPTALPITPSPTPSA